MARTPQDVTDAELTILQFLWDRGEATTRRADRRHPPRRDRLALRDGAEAPGAAGDEGVRDARPVALAARVRARDSTAKS